MSPFIDDCFIKQLILLLLIFITIHYLTKYGKCGLINIERFFLGDNFKNGIVYKLIKPVISYKNNIFYEYFFWLIIIYIFILVHQIRQSCNLDNYKLLLQDIKSFIYKKK